MVDARRRFLATGAYDPLTAALSLAARAALAASAARAATGDRASVVLDVGCGEGRHTRGVAAAVPDAVVAGVDVSKRAISLAARSHPAGWYAVASAGDLPVATAAVDVALDVFGPVVARELARVVRPGGTVVAAHPGPRHLASLRALVYSDARAHDVKPPLRDAPEWFETIASEAVTFPVVVSEPALVADLFAMTPYRWHAPPDIGTRLAEAAGAGGGLVTEADVVVTVSRRTPRP